MTKITLITGYFYPEDTAIGLYNTQLVEYLQLKGYEVNVITGFPCYPQWRINDNYTSKPVYYKEAYKQTQIYRYKQYVPSNPTFFKRIMLLMDFTLGSIINVMSIKKCDLVINVVPHTSTMFLGWILKSKTKAKIWNHIQDFEFDAVYETGLVSDKSLIKSFFFKALFKIETKFLNAADINSSISHNMMNKLENKSKTATFYFPNWIDLSSINTSIATLHPYLNSTSFKILYSGNIGDKQDWDFFIDFATKLKNEQVEIIVVGDGAKKNWLLERLNDLKNVKYYEPVEYNELSNLLSSADLHVLFQKDSVVDSVMPSKLLGMMGSSKPSLITGSDFSEVKTVIENSQGGFYVTQNKIETCYSIVKHLMESPEASSTLGLNARNYISQKFESQMVLSRFEQKLKEILNKK